MHFNRTSTSSPRPARTPAARVALCTFLFVAALVAGLAPKAALATGGERSGTATATVTAITSYDSSVTQGSDGHSITFAFTLEETVAGESFAVGDKLTVSTNIGELFSATYPLPDITVTDDKN